MLEPFIALVGAVFLSILGITIPAVVETISCWECHLGKFNWRLWKNCILVLFSFFALITGTLVSVKSIVESYANKAIWNIQMCTFFYSFVFPYCMNHVIPHVLNFSARKILLKATEIRVIGKELQKLCEGLLSGENLKLHCVLSIFCQDPILNHLNS